MKGRCFFMVEESCVRAIAADLLENKINVVSEKFNELASNIENKYKQIEELKTEINSMLDEQKRLQGEYRALTELMVSFSSEVVKETDETKEFAERFLD